VPTQYLTAVVQPRDLVVAVNGLPLGGRAGDFTDAIMALSTARPPRTLRFARAPALDPLEVALCARAQPCAIFAIEVRAYAHLHTRVIALGSKSVLLC
jgi:hypothetical protein